MLACFILVLVLLCLVVFLTKTEVMVSLSKSFHPLNSEGNSDLDLAYFENQITLQLFRGLSSIFLLNANS